MNNQGQAQGQVDEDFIDAIFYHRQAERECQEIMNGLRRGDLRNLVIEDSLRLVLANVDEVCLRLSSITELEFVSLGESTMYLAPVGAPFGPQEFTEEENDAWMQLLTFLSRIEISYLSVTVGGNLTVEMVMQVFQMVLPNSASLHLCIPHHMKLSSLEQPALLQAIQQHHRHPFVAVDVTIVGPKFYPHHFDGSATEDSIVEGSLTLDIVGQENIRVLNISAVDVTQNDCGSIAGILATRPVTYFHVSNNTVFMGNGGEIIAEAIGRSTTLECLHLPPEDNDPNFNDDAMAKVLNNNFTLKRIKRGSELNGGIAGAIASLNRAGRRYKQADNAPFKEYCMVEVLGKVSGNRDAMFYHIRENIPDLFYVADTSE